MLRSIRLAFISEGAVASHASARGVVSARLLTRHPRAIILIASADADLMTEQRLASRRPGAGAPQPPVRRVGLGAVLARRMARAGRACEQHRVVATAVPAAEARPASASTAPGAVRRRGRAIGATRGYLASGEITCVLGHHDITVSEGGFVLIPCGTPHSAWNSGDPPRLGMIVISPAGAERAFEPARTT